MKNAWLMLVPSMMFSSAFADVQEASSSSSQIEPAGVTIQPEQMITPPVAPVVSHGADFFISADFIWWKRTMNNFEYCTSGLVSSGSTSDVAKGRVKSVSFGFDPGFKVGAGLHFARDGWDLFAQYTWLNGKERKNSETQDPEKGSLSSSLYVIARNGVFQDIILTRASSKWEQHFNVLDIELGRNFFISSSLSLRPNFGLKFSWIHDDLDVFYDFSLQSATINFWDIDYKQNMWGLGIRAGLDSVWHFNKNWGIYADVALAPIWGFFESKSKQIENVDVAGIGNLNVTTLDIHANRQDIVTVFEISMGLTYMAWFNHDRYQLKLQAGWEEQVWMDMNQLINLVEYRVANMNIQGLTVKAGFEF